MHDPRALLSLGLRHGLRRARAHLAMLEAQLAGELRGLRTELNEAKAELARLRAIDAMRAEEPPSVAVELKKRSRFAGPVLVALASGARILLRR
jgi:ribosomal protein L29